MGFLASTVCVLLTHYYRLTDKFAVSLSVSRLIYYRLVSYINIMTDDRYFQTFHVYSSSRVEKGAPTVAIGIYLRVLYALQLDDDILLLAQKDEIGRGLQDLRLKQRERASKKV